MSDVPKPAANTASSSTQASRSANTQTRDELRKQLICARRQLSDTQVHEYSTAISESLLSLIKPSLHVAGYLALGNEVQINTVLKTLRQHCCKTYVPIMQKERQMVFAKIDDDTVLLKNKFGILEPDLAISTTIAAKQLDVVLVPLVGFDAHCQRMGMGGGYYDRAFATNKTSANTVKKPRLIGVAYDVQQTSSVLPDWWDVPLDLIVTETQIIKPN